MHTATIESQRLYEMICNLPQDIAEAALNFIRNIQEEDDEPLTEDEIAALAKADEDFAAGRFYTLEEVKERMARLEQMENHRLS